MNWQQAHCSLFSTKLAKMCLRDSQQQDEKDGNRTEQEQNRTEKKEERKKKEKVVEK